MTEDTTEGEQTPTRRTFMKGVGVAGLSTALLSVGPFGNNAFTPLANEFLRSNSLWSFGSFKHTIKKYGGNPAWPISTAEGDLDSLLDWVDSSDDREVIHQHAATDTATVAAPVDHIAGKRFENGLADFSYVEQVDLALVVSKVEPPNLPGSGDDHPEFSRLQQFAMGEDPAPTGELAFEAEETTLAEARDTINDSEVTETGAGTTLGVIDTGLNHDTDYFGSRLLDSSTDLTSAENPTVGSDGPEAVADGNDHGTWVTMAAAGAPPDNTYDGVAPDADILTIKALDDEGSGSTATIAQAVRYGTDNGADVLCMSLGAPVHSADLASALAYAHENGVLVVVAAGNDRPVTRFVNYPGSDSTTLAVSATTTGTPDQVQSAHFANVGPSPGTTDFSNGETAGSEVGIAAPGMEIEADLPGGNTTLSGTSMAAPFVAGAAVVVLEADGSLDGDAEGLRERLEATAIPAARLATAEAKHGLLDVSAAVSGSEADSEQADVMTSEAEARDAGYRAESAARGGLAARYFFRGDSE